jgi:hypothetical protein
MASGLRGAFTATLPGPMYRITGPSRTRLYARSQVLAMHRGLMYRITGQGDIHLSGANDNRPQDAVVDAVICPEILWLLRLTEYPEPAIIRWLCRVSGCRRALMVGA